MKRDHHHPREETFASGSRRSSCPAPARKGMADNGDGKGDTSADASNSSDAALSQAVGKLQLNSSDAPAPSPDAEDTAGEGAEAEVVSAGPAFTFSLGTVTPKKASTFDLVAPIAAAAPPTTQTSTPGNELPKQSSGSSRKISRKQAQALDADEEEYDEEDGVGASTATTQAGLDLSKGFDLGKFMAVSGSSGDSGSCSSGTPAA